jgi:hypothetical protein
MVRFWHTLVWPMVSVLLSLAAISTPAWAQQQRATCSLTSIQNGTAVATAGSQGKYTRLTNDPAVTGTSRPGATLTITPGTGQVAVYVYQRPGQNLHRTIAGLLTGGVPAGAIVQNGRTNSYRLESNGAGGAYLTNAQMNRNTGDVDFVVFRPDLNRGYTLQVFYVLDLRGAPLNFVRYNTRQTVTIPWTCVVR